MAVDRKMNLCEQLAQMLVGRVCFMGLGNPAYGDDAFGVHLAEALIAAGVPDVIVAGTLAERYLGTDSISNVDQLVFLDAVDFGAAPGSVVLLDSRQIAVRYPQISTHKISLDTLAKLVESNGVTKAWLLGVQPKSLKKEQGLTPVVGKTLGILLRLLVHQRTQEMSLC